jgi:class 3 adenylate cyclase
MAATCLNCGNENRPGRKFCASCGAPLAFTCPACGAPNEAADRFCGECGAALDPATSAVAPAANPPAAPVAERKLVSVLFLDLVGFTQLSETRDAEDVRELLSRYFETARTVIERYGGSVEKFIGDAVMAVWGAPITREDDAERAVRAALDLTAAIAALGEDAGVPTLAVRAGVATGEAAVTLGATNQGMVAGDLVNTAARVQSAAAPGSVFVTDATVHATESAVVYEDAGAHELKGKAEPLNLWRAERVVAGVGGSLRSTGLESPFVGRERELRLNQGPLPCERRRLTGAPRRRDRHRRDRQITDVVGVLQVHRRAGGPDLLAPRPLPLVRRWRELLGARGHGSDARGHLGGRGVGVDRGAPTRVRRRSDRRR